MQSVLTKLFYIFLCLSVMMLSIGVSPAHAATLTVNTLVDENDGSCLDADCSLRDAIQVAAENDTINFGVNGTITLSLGQLTINKNLTIMGPGSANLTVSGNNTSRIFLLPPMTPTKTVSISGMTMTNGNASSVAMCGGGAIRNNAFLNLNDVVLNGNSALVADPCVYPRGGAIMVMGGEGSLTITNSTISNNSTFWDGGGIYFYATEGTLSLTNVMVDGNQSTGNDGGGVAFAGGNVPAEFDHVTFNNNDASQFGGGLQVASGASALVTSSTFSFNSTIAQSGGALTADYNVTLTILDTTFSGNFSGNKGGALYLLNSTTAVGSSTFTDNITSASGASTRDGGAIYNLGRDGTSTLVVYNSTFNGNSATNGRGGAIMGHASHSSQVTGDVSTVTIINSTIVENMAQSSGAGGGVYSATDSNVSETSTLTLQNSIVYGNSLVTGTNGANCALLNTGAIVTDSNNLFNNVANDCIAGASDITSSGDITTIVNNLANNGGETQTMSLPTDSPAINAGDNTICADTPVNNESQNGVTRPSGSVCDIGAYEKSSAPTSPTFGDVPMNHPYWLDIEILYANGFTAGCSASPLLFCPEDTMNRGQSAVFILRGNFGSAYLPPNPPYTTTFADSWAPGPWAQKWAQGMLAEGLTAGCSVTGPLLYCPWDQTPRLQAAVFGMRLLNGNAYVPPAATGTVFADITDPNLWYAKWAEQAYLSGILPDCGTQGGKPLFCPNDIVSRGLGAYMIVRAKNLSMP